MAQKCTTTTITTTNNNNNNNIYAMYSSGHFLKYVLWKYLIEFPTKGCP